MRTLRSCGRMRRDATRRKHDLSYRYLRNLGYKCQPQGSDSFSVMLPEVTLS